MRAESRGVKRGEKGVYLPDPGYYGQFHEGGCRTGGVPYRRPKKFMREAKKKNIGIIEQVIERFFNERLQELFHKEMLRIRSERNAARRNGNRVEPVDGYPR